MERNGSESPVLIAQTGPLNGRRWTLNKEITIGRDSACDVIIIDRQVSRFHARVAPEEDGVMLEDLASKNGTYCNGIKLSDTVKLQDGDSIQIALIQYFVYLSSDATMPLESGPALTEISEFRLVLDSRSRRVWVNHLEVLPPLSVPQFTLLQVLYDRKDQVVSRQELVEAIWGGQQAEGVSEQAVDALVRRLRDRLSALDPSHNYIVTVRGHGLRLENPKGLQ
jgi:DNA-binding winged helix-turn-helix (wHTH) protein